MEVPTSGVVVPCRRGKGRVTTAAGAFRLTFRRPVCDPIALGWSSHFGMGLFVPVLSHPRQGKEQISLHLVFDNSAASAVVVKGGAGHARRDESIDKMVIYDRACITDNAF